VSHDPKAGLLIDHAAARLSCAINWNFPSHGRLLSRGVMDWNVLFGQLMWAMVCRS